MYVANQSASGTRHKPPSNEFGSEEIAHNRPWLQWYRASGLPNPQAPRAFTSIFNGEQRRITSCAGYRKPPAAVIANVARAVLSQWAVEGEGDVPGKGRQ